MLASMDWSASPVGDPSRWSPTLRAAVDLVEHTRFPATLLWGPEAVLLYNAAYVPILAEKHPEAYGRPAREVFPEVWDDLVPFFERAMDAGEASWLEDASVPLERHGRVTEGYFTYSYSPVQGPGGRAEGVLDIVWETTTPVIERRRQALLAVLREGLLDVADPAQVVERALIALGADPDDFAEVAVGTGGPGDDRHVIATGTGPERPRLLVRPGPLVAVDASYQAFLRAVGFSLAQAYDRLAAGEAERRLADLERRMSETLQLSLLPDPVQPPGLEVAVRYRPAAEAARIGGDWYDSFLDPEGRLTLVVGDVTGHDRSSAAAMAQVRNLLRGVVWERGAPPSVVLGGVDRAITGLGMDALATAVVARVEDDGNGAAPTLRWSNAGHPPPVLLRPDGTTELLETRPDALLGLMLGRREDHTAALEPGTALVLYTDGLVERPGTILDEGFAWLTGFLAGRQGQTADELADAVLAGLRTDVDDDVAVLVLRIAPAS